jgi:hypothetical protein
MTPAGLTFFCGGLVRGKSSFNSDAISFHWGFNVCFLTMALQLARGSSAGLTGKVSGISAAGPT